MDCLPLSYTFVAIFSCVKLNRVLCPTMTNGKIEDVIITFVEDKITLFKAATLLGNLPLWQLSRNKV